MAAPSQGPRLTLRTSSSYWWKKPTGSEWPTEPMNESHRESEKMGPLVWSWLIKAWQPMSPSSQRQTCILESWMLNCVNLDVELRKLECWILPNTMLNRETNNVKSTIGVEKLETCWIADVSTNCKTTTSNAKNTSKIQKLNFGAHWTPYYLYTLLYQTNTFHVAVRLFSNRSQKTSKCGKNISDALGYRIVCHIFLFLPHFDVICDLSLNTRTATWNLFVN